MRWPQEKTLIEWLRDLEKQDLQENVHTAEGWLRIMGTACDHLDATVSTALDADAEPGQCQHIAGTGSSTHGVGLTQDADACEQASRGQDAMARDGRASSCGRVFGI